jgi:uncharacterized Rmd1/YagE family protein
LRLPLIPPSGMGEEPSPRASRASMSDGHPTPITAIALDGGVDIAAAARRLRWPETRRYKYGSVYELDGHGRIFLFAFGAVVYEGAAIDESVLKVVEDAVERTFLKATTETYYISVNPEQTATSPRVGWDQVVIPERSAVLIGAVALLMGQSAALERYEKAAEVLIDEALVLSRQLAQHGRSPRATKVQVQRVGRITSDRLELASLFYFLDRPEETWEDPRVSALYDALFKNLELADRHQATLQKLQAVENVTDIVINVWQSKVSVNLEVAIVMLIVFEILLALFKLA